MKIEKCDASMTLRSSFGGLGVFSLDFVWFGFDVCGLDTGIVGNVFSDGGACTCF